VSREESITRAGSGTSIRTEVIVVQLHSLLTIRWERTTIRVEVYDRRGRVQVVQFKVVLEIQKKEVVLPNSSPNGEVTAIKVIKAVVTLSFQQIKT